MLKTRREDWLFVVTASLIWLAGLGVTARDWMRHRQPGHYFGLLNAAGLGLAILGVCIRLSARNALRRQFAYALRVLDDHQLVQNGLYRHIRHPAYTGDLIFQLGLPLLFSSYAGCLVMLLLIPCFIYQMGIEERMLVDKFGDAYREYTQRTKRLVPHVY